MKVEKKYNIIHSSSNKPRAQTISKCPAAQVAMNFYCPNRQLVKPLLVLHHDSLFRKSGRVDFSCPEAYNSNMYSKCTCDSLYKTCCCLITFFMIPNMIN